MDKSLSNLMAENRFVRREFSEPHNLYADEVRLLDAVRSGNVTLARKLASEPMHGTPGRLSDDLLRNQKNLLIARVTTVSRAAIEGGMSNEESFTMSDAYIVRGEHCKTGNEVIDLAIQVVIDYTTCVAEVQKQLRSPITEKAMDYISKHLHYAMTLDEMARSINISTSYLSRLFHKETGMTLASYIQKERIHAAQNMLRFSDYSYLEIATYLNFKSQSYFIAVFKKFTGMTPMQFRQSL